MHTRAGAKASSGNSSRAPKSSVQLPSSPTKLSALSSHLAAGALTSPTLFHATPDRQPGAKMVLGLKTIGGFIARPFKGGRPQTRREATTVSFLNRQRALQTLCMGYTYKPGPVQGLFCEAGWGCL